MSMSITHVQGLPSAIYSSPEFAHAKNKDWHAQYSVGLLDDNFIIWIEFNENHLEQVEKIAVSSDAYLADDLNKAKEKITRRGYKIKTPEPSAADLQLLSVEYLEKNRLH